MYITSYYGVSFGLDVVEYCGDVTGKVSVHNYAATHCRWSAVANDK